ncbi:MAG: hypothetical protein SWK90_09285 [Chloroflexota bacterium]|nr:hypothetical protein [Chloroflexota bacterium]
MPHRFSHIPALVSGGRTPGEQARYPTGVADIWSPSAVSDDKRLLPDTTHHKQP